MPPEDNNQSDNTLSQLADIIAERKIADPDSSYVASLNHKGLDSILKKVGEEATETVVAAKNTDPDQVIYETADLWFHTLVMLDNLNLRPEAVLQELQRRFGQSGIEEKASRKKQAK